MLCYFHMCIKIAVKKLPKKLPSYMLVSVILKEDVEYSPFTRKNVNFHNNLLAF